MIAIKNSKHLLPIRLFGLFFMAFGCFALYLEEPVSSTRISVFILVSYLMWGLSFSTRIEAKKVIKQRGWFFPSFRKAYQNLTRIELRAKYIHQQGHGAHSFYALYVGVINGPFNDFVDLSWGVKSTDDADSYLSFIQQLQQLTQLPVTVTKEFSEQFKQKFDQDFDLS